MQAFFSWKPRACQLEESRRKNKKLEKQRVTREGRAGQRGEYRYRKCELTKWFYLQIWGWGSELRRRIGIKRHKSRQRFTILLFVEVFMAGVSLSSPKTPAIPTISRFTGFKSTSSFAQLPSPLSLSAFSSSKVGRV